MITVGDSQHTICLHNSTIIISQRLGQGTRIIHSHIPPNL